MSSCRGVLVVLTSRLFEILSPGPLNVLTLRLRVILTLRMLGVRTLMAVSDSWSAPPTVQPLGVRTLELSVPLTSTPVVTLS